MTRNIKIKSAGFALSLILLFGTVSGVSLHNSAFAQLSDIPDVIAEAENGSGATVFYTLPTETNNVQVSSIVCSPSSGSIFSLGESIVFCNVIDVLENQSEVTFTISVLDTIPPQISQINELSLEATKLFTQLELATPTVSDAVDPFPLIVNDAPELFPLGTTDVTWTATDFNGNSATQIQKITLNSKLPEIIADPEMTLEAKSLETPTSDIEFNVIGVSSLEFELVNDAPEFLPLGTTEITWTITDQVDNVATMLQKVNLVDTTLPEIDAKIYAQVLDEKKNEGTFRIFYDVRDAVDFSPAVSATLNNVAVSNGQFVTLAYDDDKEKVETKKGVLKFTGTSFTLEITALDFSGNLNTMSVSASFEPLIEEEIMDLEIEELSIDDLKALLEKLQTVPTTDLNNLGQELQSLKFIANLLFDQEKQKIKDLKGELKEQIKLASDDEKKLLQREYKDLIKESRDEFKSLQSQYKEIFHEYKSVAKLMLKEKKDIKGNELEKELEKITTRLSQNEDSRQNQLDEEKIRKQMEMDGRTDAIFSKIMQRISIIDLSHDAKENFEALHAIKSEDITSKDKQKLIQVILKTSDKSLKKEFKQIIKDVKKDEKALKKTLKLQAKELKAQEKALKKLEKEKLKLTKLQEKELKKLEKELKKLEKEKLKQVEKAEKEAKKLEKQLEKKAKDVQKDLKKEAKKAEKEAKKEAKKAEKEAKKEAKKAEKEAKKAEKESKKG